VVDVASDVCLSLVDRSDDAIFVVVVVTSGDEGNDRW
jgi:hypothetical protein